MQLDPNIKQDTPTSCAIKCQQIIMRDYGIDVDECNLRKIAIEQGWYAEETGVFMRDNGKLLGCFGIGYHHSQNNTIEALKNELLKRHRIMVNLSHAILTGKADEDKHHEACHAVIVTQIVDGKDGYVVVTDPAEGCANKRYRIDDFIKAWNTSNHYYLATDSSAQYEYDAETQTMKPLNT